MKKSVIHTLLAGAALLSAACTEKEEFFYSTSQQITEVEASVVLNTPTPEPEPQEAQERISPSVVEEIRRELLAKLPSKAGDTYVFHFAVYNAGVLELHAGETVTEGRFTKVPGSQEIGFLFDGGEYHIAKVSSDSDTPTRRYTFDFTEEYRRRYPDADIKEAKRIEHISE